MGAAGAGNGNFGIVTSLTYRVHPMTDPVYVTAKWAGLDDLVALFDAWQRFAPSPTTGSPASSRSAATTSR